VLERVDQVAWVRLLGWTLVGAALAIGILGALSIGIFLLPVAIAVGVLLLVRPEPGRGATGLLCGIGLPLLLVAYLNRDGPGTVCTATSGGGQSCTDEWAPWPWLAIGLLLITAGLATFALSEARR
jgi:hypothetical protein